MTRKTLVLFLTAALPLAAAWAGEGPATPPANPGGQRPGGGFGGGPGGPGGRGGRGGPFMQYDPKTLDEALAFWEKETPFRYAAFKLMDEEKKERVKGLIVHKYRSWNWERNPEIKDVKVKQIRTEDEIFKVKFQLDKLAAEAPEAQPLKKDLKAAVEALVGLELEERRLQLDDFEKVLREQRQELKDKLAKKADTVEERYEKFLNASMSPVPGDGGPRRPDGHRKDDKREEKKDDRKPPQ
jgi:hypothetical protein